MRPPVSEGLPIRQTPQRISELYPIDSNFIKQLRSLKSKRDISAHVVDDDLTAKYLQLKSYLADLVESVKKIQQNHEKKYLDVIMITDGIDATIKTGTFLGIQPSQVDKHKFLDQLIVTLKNASSFREAENYESIILNFRNNLTTPHVEKILVIVFENSQEQVLLAGGTSNFLHELYKLQKVDDKKWKDFYRKFLGLYKESSNMIETYKWLC